MDDGKREMSASDTVDFETTTGTDLVEAYFGWDKVKATHPVFAGDHSRLSKEARFMPRITYIEHNGTEHAADVPVGKSVMQGAVENNVPGIDADCGGECACATCHVYVDAAWLSTVGPPPAGSQEASMLSFAAVTQPDSRLSCQIPVTNALDGLVVRMPEGQH
jgi:ferredoxin, 2Fe-2S